MRYLIILALLSGCNVNKPVPAECNKPVLSPEESFMHQCGQYHKTVRPIGGGY